MSVSKPVILASQSLQRRELFASLGIPFTVRAANIDELAITHPDHAQRAALVAQAKGEKVAIDHPLAVIVSADTFVVFNDQRFEKPESKEEATEMLTTLSGQSVICYTGWSVIDPFSKEKHQGAVLTKLKFRDLSKGEIERYVSTQPVTSWAGGFSIVNADGVALIESLSGSLSGLLGLPLEVLIPVLHRSLIGEAV